MPAPLLLDLLNSRLYYPDHMYDELADSADASTWLRAHDADGSAAQVDDARRARDALVPFVRGDAEADVLRPWIDSMRKVPSVTASGVDWTTDVDDDLAIGARAIEEWSSLQTDVGSRIRPCANPDCQHFFIDTSKANVRKWHSMETCGNRMKSRRHYARSKESAQPETPIG
jgi:predicted RNA-binding Zn ribbon-like protein